MLLLDPDQQPAEAIGPLEQVAQRLADEPAHEGCRAEYFPLVIDFDDNGEQVARYPNALHARPSHVLMDVFIEHRISPLPGPA